MLLTRKIDSDLLSRLMRLYEDAFPPEERRPVEQMLPSDPEFKLYAIGEHGLLTAWEFPEVTYIEHFAVFPESRGQGIGSKALAELKGSVILEVEPHEAGIEAAKRIAFYERNGFRLLDRDYVQPSYGHGLPPVALKLMLRGTTDVDRAVNLIHEKVYRSSRHASP